MRLLGLALAAWLAVPLPAMAMTYGGWNAHLSLDSWYDDNLSRGLVVTPADLPNGNQDLGLHLGASLGNVWLVTPDVDAWVIVDAHGSRGVFYPDLSDAWGSLIANTIWHMEGGREASLMLGSSAFWGNGLYHALAAGFGQPVWYGGVARLEGGASLYATDVSGAGFWMPSLGGGLDQDLPTGTRLSLRYAFQPRFYDDSSPDPRHQVLVRVGQRFLTHWEAHASYLETLDTSSSGGYAEGYFGLGIAYDL